MLSLKGNYDFEVYNPDDCLKDGVWNWSDPRCDYSLLNLDEKRSTYDMSLILESVRGYIDGDKMRVQAIDSQGETADVDLSDGKLQATAVDDQGEYAKVDALGDRLQAEARDSEGETAKTKMTDDEFKFEADDGKSAPVKDSDFPKKQPKLEPKASE